MGGWMSSDDENGGDGRGRERRGRREAALVQYSTSTVQSSTDRPCHTVTSALNDNSELTLWPVQRGDAVQRPQCDFQFRQAG